MTIIHSYCWGKYSIFLQLSIPMGYEQCFKCFQIRFKISMVRQTRQGCSPNKKLHV